MAAESRFTLKGPTMSDVPRTPGPPQRKSWLGRFLGIEVILNDRRRHPRDGDADAGCPHPVPPPS
jgi:hypothetical protein